MVSTVNFRSSRSLLRETKAKPSTSAKTFPSTCLNRLGAGTWWVSVEMLHPTAPILSPGANWTFRTPRFLRIDFGVCSWFLFYFFPLLEIIMEKKNGSNTEQSFCCHNFVYQTFRESSRWHSPSLTLQSWPEFPCSKRLMDESGFPRLELISKGFKAAR